MCVLMIDFPFLLLVLLRPLSTVLLLLHGLQGARLRVALHHERSKEPETKDSLIVTDVTPEKPRLGVWYMCTCNPSSLNTKAGGFASSRPAWFCSHTNLVANLHSSSHSFLTPSWLIHCVTLR